MSAAIDHVVGLVSMGVGITEQEFRDALAEAWVEGFGDCFEWANSTAEAPPVNPYYEP